MNFQLVIKFYGQPLPDEALMTAITSALKDALGDTAALDGHDVKDGEINLFVLTDDVDRAFRRVRRVLEAQKIEQGFAAASRLVGGAQFKSIWPPRGARKFKLR